MIPNPVKWQCRWIITMLTTDCVRNGSNQKHRQSIRSQLTDKEMQITLVSMKRCSASLINEITLTVSIGQIDRNKELCLYTILVGSGRHDQAYELWVEVQGFCLFWNHIWSLTFPFMFWSLLLLPSCLSLTSVNPLSSLQASSPSFPHPGIFVYFWGRWF